MKWYSIRATAKALNMTDRQIYRRVALGRIRGVDRREEGSQMPRWQVSENEIERFKREGDR